MIDPFNDNSSVNYERWLQIKQPYVTVYLKNNNDSLDLLGLNASGALMLKLNKIDSISSLVGMKEKDISRMPYSSEITGKEVYRKCFSYLKDIRTELVAYVDSLENDPDTSGDVSIDEGQRLLAGENRKAEYIAYLETHNVPIERFDLSNRTYNAMKRVGINYLLDAVRLYPDGFASIRNMGQKSIDEIKLMIEKEASVYAGRNLYEEAKSLDTDDVHERLPENVHEALLDPDYKDKVYEFFSYKSMPIDSLGLDTRSYNYLSRNGKDQFVDMLPLYPDKMSNVKGLGDKSVTTMKSVVFTTLERYNNAVMDYISGNVDSLFDDEYLIGHILGKYSEFEPFYGISFSEFRAGLHESISEERLKKCIGKLLADKVIEYVDYRCYKVYPSFYSVIDEMSSEKPNDGVQMLKEHYRGRTLEDIGTEAGVSRERVRQKVVKAFDKVATYALLKYNCAWFDEDYYSYLYENYDLSKPDLIDLLGISPDAYGYLRRRYKSKNRPIEEALADDRVSASLKLKILDVQNKGMIKIDGVLLLPQRNILEDYIISRYCKEEIGYEEFCGLYNEVLKKNGIPYSDKIYITLEVVKTRQNRLMDSRSVLWKTGMKFRYYNIDGRDYQELLDAIGIEGYSNTGLSTLYWMNNYPEIMERYDIRDQYELHNLLKKTIPEGSYNDIRFDRMPGVLFGAFDRDRMIYETMVKYAPISTEDLARIMYEEYGYDKGTCIGTYFSCLRNYCHDSVYSIDYKSIPDSRRDSLINALSGDLYFDHEVNKIYFDLFPDADREEINPRSMKEIGFNAYRNYYLNKRWTSSVEYFTYLLTKEDQFDCSEYNKRYAYTQMYTDTLRNMRASFDIFCLKDGTTMSINTLKKMNISKDDIKEYCDEVKRFVGDGSFFTVHSIANAGFSSFLNVLKYDYSFYEGILEACGLFNSTHCSGTVVFSSDKNMHNFTKSDFVIALLKRFGSIDMNDFIDYLSEEYGIVFKNHYSICAMIKDTELFYDPITGKIYSNREAYYDDLV